MTFDITALRRGALRPLVAAVLGTALGAVMSAAVQARDANELLLKAVGTTDDVSPVIVEAIKHAAMDLTPEQRKLALECWKNNV